LAHSAAGWLLLEVKGKKGLMYGGLNGVASTQAESDIGFS